jgi:hypothetical protein
MHSLDDEPQCQSFNVSSYFAGNSGYFDIGIQVFLFL